MDEGQENRRAVSVYPTSYFHPLMSVSGN